MISIFIKRVGRFVLIPLSIVTIMYFFFDPYKVLYKKKSYFKTSESRYVTPNYDYIDMETFLNNYPTYKYDSFIIGNSRSRFYEMRDWQKYINSDKCFHFNASNETLYGICKKIEFLHKKNVRLANVLLVIDYTVLTGITNSEGHLYTKHPILTGQNMLSFKLLFYKAFCSPRFLVPYLHLKISGHFYDYMNDIMDKTLVDYELKYNEMKYANSEKIIKVNPNKYYTNALLQNFYKRDMAQHYTPEIVGNKQIVMLKYISKIFKKHSTSIKIIISPLYDQLKLNDKDLAKLNDIFEAKNVFDFSGINSITSNYHNYYESSHYRPFVSKQLISRIYGKTLTTN